MFENKGLGGTRPQKTTKFLPDVDILYYEYSINVGPNKYTNFYWVKSRKLMYEVPEGDSRNG